MNQFSDLNNATFQRAILALVCVVALLNFYYLLAGHVFSFLPIILQSSFLFFFALSHRYYRNIGLILFGLTALSGVFGLIASCAFGLQLSLEADPINHERLTFKSSSTSITFFVVGIWEPKHL
jgi:hypothetical protein